MSTRDDALLHGKHDTCSARNTGGENLEDQRNFTSVSIDTPTNSGQNSSNSYTGNKPEPQTPKLISIVG